MTESSTLAATLRTQSGKGFARRLRMKGLIPAVCYGPHDQPVHIAIDPLALKKAIATPHKFNTVLTVAIEGGAKKTVLLKDFEHDPLDYALLHADFLEVRMDMDVVVQVPVVLVGKPAGAAEGGILQQVSRTLPVECKPNQIPEKIEADVSALKIAESLHVSDMKVPAGIKIKVGAGQDPTIAVVAIPEKEEEVKPAAVAEGAAAPGAVPSAADEKAAAKAGEGDKGAEKGAAPAKGEKAADKGAKK